MTVPLETSDDLMRKAAELAVKAMTVQHPRGYFVSFDIDTNAHVVSVWIYPPMVNGKCQDAVVSESAWMEMNNGKEQMRRCVAALERFLLEACAK